MVPASVVVPVAGATAGVAMHRAAVEAPAGGLREGNRGAAEVGSALTSGGCSGRGLAAVEAAGLPPSVAVNRDGDGEGEGRALIDSAGPRMRYSCVDSGWWAPPIPGSSTWGLLLEVRGALHGAADKGRPCCRETSRGMRCVLTSSGYRRLPGWREGLH